jgi:hypothetical protein
MKKIVFCVVFGLLLGACLYHYRDNLVHLVCPNEVDDTIHLSGDRPDDNRIFEVLYVNEPYWVTTRILRRRVLKSSVVWCYIDDPADIHLLRVSNKLDTRPFDVGLMLYLQGENIFLFDFP